MKNKLKNKKRIIPKIFIAITSMFSIIGVGASFFIKDTYKSARAVSYDDEQYSITLSADELNNYSFHNLANYFKTLEAENFANTYLYYIDEDDNYSLDDFIPTDSITYALDTDYIGLDLTIYNVWSIDRENGFASGIVYHLNSTIYSNSKSAIELDIAANQTPHDMGTDIIAGIVSGLGLIGDLASKFLTGFKSLFWANNQLTHFAIFSLCMLGIAISFAVVKLIMELIRSNTGV